MFVLPSLPISSLSSNYLALILANLKDYIEKILEDLSLKNFSVTDNLFSKNITENIVNTFNELEDQNKFQQSSIGKNSNKTIETNIRGDEIFWFDQQDQLPALNPFFEFINEFKASLRHSFFLPVKRFEAHFTRYPIGTFYKKHKDQHINTPHRLVSCVYYLSEWKKDFGGELVIYEDSQKHVIEPIQGRFCCFLSSKIPHEVLPCHYVRKAITGWLRDDE